MAWFKSAGRTTRSSRLLNLLNLEDRCMPAVELDASFSGDGKQTSDFGGSEIAQDVVIQSDGKILVAGGGNDFLIARYNTNGSLDSTFGSGGLVTGNGFTDGATEIAVQNDGKIIVVGSLTFSGTTEFAVSRFNSNGSVDNTFDGDGLFSFGLGGTKSVINSVAIQSDGRIIVAGTQDNDLAIARILSNGGLDTSFGGTGKVIGNSFTDNGMDVAIQSDGKIVIVGSLTFAGTTEFAVSRFNSNGSVDNTFDGDGLFSFGFGGTKSVANSLAIQSDGRIIVAGTQDDDLTIARILSNGGLDTSFGSTGKVIGNSFTDNGMDVAIQSDGKVVVVGSLTFGGITEFMMSRYESGGALDNSFDSDGLMSFGFGGTGSAANAVAIQSDGSLVVAGGNDGNFAVARVTNVNTPPTITTPIPDSTEAEDSANLVINLANHFTDAQDGSLGLTYTVISNSNGQLLTTTINSATLTLDFLDNAHGSTDITVRATDSKNASITDTFTINVNPINDVPMVNQPIPDSTVAEDATNLVINLANHFADIENGSLGLTYTVIANSNGQLLTTTINSATLTLDFIANAHGSTNITVRATDSSNASITDTFTINVNSVNDVPVVNQLIPDRTVAEDAVNLVINLANHFADIEDGSLGLTYTITANSNGQLLTTAINSATLTLDFLANAHGLTDITVRATDSSNASITDTFTINITPVNDAPVLNTASTPMLPTIAEDSTTHTGINIAMLLGTTLTDVDSNAAEGIAIIASTGTGTWQYRLSANAAWTGFIPSATAARLLPATAFVRFLPAANFNGSATITYRGWDCTFGNAGATANLSTFSSVGGATSFSTASEIANVTITPVNDAPVLNTAPTPRFPNVPRNSTRHTGTTVAALLGSAVTDVDAGAKRGIAVIGLTGTTSGTWQYSLNGGSTWVSFTATTTTARLLRDTDRIRFVPRTNFVGTVTLQYRAWDQTAGSAGSTANVSTAISVGGATAFSLAAETASLTVL